MDRWFYYVRVSSKWKQKTDRQIYSGDLRTFCERNGVNEKDIIVMEEKETGKHFERPQYQLLKKVVSSGDNIIVSAIDRFGRNYIQGRKEFAELINGGVKVYVLNRPMLEDMYKLNDNMSKFMINFLVDWELMNAEEELKRIKERQSQGIKVAKAQNKHLGRPRAKYPEAWEQYYSEMKAGMRTRKATMDLLGLKSTTFYKLKRLWEGKVK
ncbi:recombinase family protein [Clostridium sp. 19966]|uniref:recombinase family protein n=1 Tax=Clostridium sp. 19966 TaxID=2768166 RepID=UPI0028DE75FA|nr:recombinase family protein [Clostridium sp. 19966]MDT8718198.1 recombinase family protein [Clostridium sp. 19966]